MKPLNIWQRLNLALLFLVLLLLAGVGLAFWVQHNRDTAERRQLDLLRARDRIAYDILLITDSLRALSLDPKNKLEQNRTRDAESDLRTRVTQIQTEFTEFPSLITSLRELSDFVLVSPAGALGDFRNRVLGMAENDPANAITYYNVNYAPIAAHRDLLLRDLALQIDAASTRVSQEAQTASILGIGGLLLLLVASLLVGRFQSTAIATPLGRLVATLQQMRQGDFSRRVQLAQDDEFGVVAGDLNGLADDLCDLVGQVQRSGLQVNTTTTQMAATAREQQTTAHEIAATTTEIGATSREISATSNELVKTMRELSQVADHTAGVAGTGQTAIARMEATMRQIIEASGSVTAKLAVLSEKTANINSVVTTITKVADQTNLLSLNAAIEAEKAGEYGLGFAVVAMEIRRLADQTAVATYDIEKMVKEMQAAVAAGVLGMDKFSDEVRQGVEEVRQVSSLLAEVIKQVQALMPRFQAVNEGMHAQATGAQQISDTLTQLSESARQTAESLRQSNLAIEQLNSAARGLHMSVARFKLTSSQSPEPASESIKLGI